MGEVFKLFKRRKTKKPNELGISMAETSANLNLGNTKYIVDYKLKIHLYKGQKPQSLMFYIKLEKESFYLIN